MNDWKHQIANDVTKEHRVVISPPNGNGGVVPPWMVSPPVQLPPTPAQPLPGPDEPDAED